MVSENAQKRLDLRMQHPDICFVDTTFGGVRNRNNVRRIDEIVVPEPATECYQSMFRFREEYKQHCEETGSVKGIDPLPCYADFLWFDIDDINLENARFRALELLVGLEKNYRVGPDEVLIFFSGHKGFHVGIPTELFGAAPCPDLHTRFSMLAKALAGDILVDFSIYEKNRLWRIPNSINSKSGLFKIRLSYEELVRLDCEEIRVRSKSPQDRPSPYLKVDQVIEENSTLKKLYWDLPRDFASMHHLDNLSWGSVSAGSIAVSLQNLREGNRNNTFFRIAVRLNQNGWTPQEIRALLGPHAQNSGFSAEELFRLVEGVCHRYPQNNSFHVSNIYSEKHETIEEPLKAIKFKEFLEESGGSGPEWRVEQILPMEGVCIIAGLAGLGKSWMLLDLAISCASVNGKWLDHFPVKQGRVLYIDEENGKSFLLDRAKRLSLHKRVRESDLDAHFVVGQGVNFATDKGVEALRQLMLSLRPDIVIADSLIRFHAADENSASEMARFFGRIKGLVRKFGCLFVFADHQRKPYQFNLSPDLLLRGSTEKAAFVDSLLSLQKKNDQLVVYHSKSRFAEALPPFVIRLTKLTEETTSITYQGLAEEIELEDRIREANALILEHLSHEEWTSRKQLIDARKGTGISIRSVDEGLKKLLAEGKIVKKQDPQKSGRGKRGDLYSLAPGPDLHINGEDINDNERGEE